MFFTVFFAVIAAVIVLFFAYIVLEICCETSSHVDLPKDWKE